MVILKLTVPCSGTQERQEALKASMYCLQLMLVIFLPLCVPWWSSLESFDRDAWEAFCKHVDAQSKKHPGWIYHHVSSWQRSFVCTSCSRGWELGRLQRRGCGSGWPENAKTLNWNQKSSFSPEAPTICPFQWRCEQTCQSQWWYHKPPGQRQRLIISLWFWFW